jgi:hypothetical protein
MFDRIGENPSQADTEFPVLAGLFFVVAMSIRADAALPSGFLEENTIGFPQLDRGGTFTA